MLHLSGEAAYGRIEAARVARRYPVVLGALSSGSVSMTVVALLRPHLTDANHRDLLAQAHHKSKRQVEQLVAGLAPKPAVPATIRRLPPAVAHAAYPERETPALPREDPPIHVEPTAHRVAAPVAPAPLPPPVVGAASHRPVVAPLAPERFRVQFTMSRTTHDSLRRAQDLLRHVVPNGDPAEIFERAATLLIEHLERTKLGKARRPREQCAAATHSRHIPAAVRREVWRRDGGRCGFVGSTGRCAERSLLELHHVVPYADGGPATVENIQLRAVDAMVARPSGRTQAAADRELREIRKARRQGGRRHRAE